LQLPTPDYPTIAFPGARHEKKSFFEKHVSEPFKESFKESWNKASDEQQKKQRAKDDKEWRQEQQRRVKHKERKAHGVIGGDADEHKGFCVIV
jgi:hypothetical protein